MPNGGIKEGKLSMERKDLLSGILRAGGYLITESGKIRLKEHEKGSDQSHKPVPIDVDPDSVGKMAFVRGNLVKKVLNDAKIVEVLSPVTGSLINSLADKGILSLDEIREQLGKLESEDPKRQEQRKKCALVIGHKKKSPGALNPNTGIKEFDFNEALAISIEGKTTTVEIQRIYRRTYKDLPGDINQYNPHFTISLHCNAFNKEVSGTEILYYYKSQKGKMIAEILKNALVEHLKLPDRGLKPKTSEDRGGYLLRYTKAPCVIAEPFFIDNDDDLARAQEDLEGLAMAYAKAIDTISLIL
jgi:N-acetylmuramoyl-L-alanine amidase